MQAGTDLEKAEWRERGDPWYELCECINIIHNQRRIPEASWERVGYFHLAFGLLFTNIPQDATALPALYIRE